MNALENDQTLGTKKSCPATLLPVDLIKMAKPVGPVGDLILKFRNGELVAADTGDQGGGQN